MHVVICFIAFGRRICPVALWGPTPTDLGSDSDLEHRAPQPHGLPVGQSTWNAYARPGANSGRD